MRTPGLECMYHSLTKFSFLICKIRLLYFLLKIIVQTDWRSSQLVESAFIRHYTGESYGGNTDCEWGDGGRGWRAGTFRAEWDGFSEGVSGSRHSMSKSPELRNTMAGGKLTSCLVGFQCRLYFTLGLFSNFQVFCNPTSFKHNNKNQQNQKVRNSTSKCTWMFLATLFNIA